MEAPRSWIARMEVRHILGALALAGLAAAFLMDPHASPAHVTLLGIRVPSVCTFRNVTGYPCPSCGMTRSVCFTARGDLGHALAAHPIGPLFTLAMAGQALYLLASLAIPAVARTSPRQNLVGLFYLALVTAMLVVGALRTLRYIPWPPS